MPRLRRDFNGDLSSSLLDAGAEKALWDEYFAGSCSERRKSRIEDALVRAHLRQCHVAAQSYSARFHTIPYNDLYSAACEGLAIAIKTFDRSRHARLATHARIWIKSCISDHLTENFSSFRLKSSDFIRYLSSNYIKLRNKMEAQSPDIRRSEIHMAIVQGWIKQNKLKQAKVLPLMKKIDAFAARLDSAGLTVNAAVRVDGDKTEWIETIPDHSAVPALDLVIAQERQRLTAGFIEAARARFLELGKAKEWDILSARLLVDHEDRERRKALGQRIGVSPTRVQQLERDAVKIFKEFGEGFREAWLLKEHLREQPPSAQGNQTAPVKPLVLRAQAQKRLYQAIRHGGEAFIAECQTAVREAKLFKDRVADRNWDIFFRLVIKTPPDTNESLAEEYGIHWNSVVQKRTKIENFLIHRLRLLEEAAADHARDIPAEERTLAVA